MPELRPPFEELHLSLQGVRIKQNRPLVPFPASSGRIRSLLLVLGGGEAESKIPNTPEDQRGGVVLRPWRDPHRGAKRSLYSPPPT
jgi:hypothetical protein